MKFDNDAKTAKGHQALEVYPEQELTHKILEAAFAVRNALGAGFLEKVYENALALELRAKGIACRQQLPLQVRYKDAVVGD